ncbi:NAD(P)/FAD-dependent oxidoreductase [Amycolatopsis sp. ATCC 39116]|uniref:NAD(P)/FAD-dependent oxidoreductase n=1 Tax=Amycolatopsis sp. (strain ATCC 39116 / 75iv2) TaxID=385957 RepID=UPI0002628988|nr:FAD-dependent oxidoreductase [Amycolatopsis sp. ATCC 39116]
MRDDVDVTLVNPRPAFVDRVRLHQFVAGTGETTVDYGTMLDDGVHLVVDTATRIDTTARAVRLASGRELGYDYLVYAVGSTAAAPPVPGAAEFAVPIAELESARRLRDELAALPPEAPVTVVGGGPTGIETAAELAERGRRVTLVCGGTLAPSLSAGGRRYIAKWLSRHGVAVAETVKVAEVRPDAVVFADGTTRPSALTIWSAGFAAPELAAASGLRTDDLGRLLTDETLTSVDDHRIVAAGDSAAPSGQSLRMSYQVAARCAGRRHPVEPHPRHRTAGARRGSGRVVRQPRQARRRAAVRPQGRHRAELPRRRPPRRGLQGADPQARFPAVGEGRTAGHRPSDRSSARNSDSYSFAGSVTCGPRCP